MIFCLPKNETQDVSRRIGSSLQVLKGVNKFQSIFQSTSHGFIFIFIAWVVEDQTSSQKTKSNFSSWPYWLSVRCANRKVGVCSLAPYSEGNLDARSLRICLILSDVRPVHTLLWICLNWSAVAVDVHGLQDHVMPPGHLVCSCELFQANSVLWARLLGTFFDQISSHAELVEWFGKRSGKACKITRQHSALPCFLASFSFSCITPCRVMGPIVLPVKKGNPFQPWQKLVVSSQNLVKLDHIPNFRGKQFKRQFFDNHHLLGCPDGT